MIRGIKRCGIKLCLIFLFFLCVNSWFTISASAYTNETVNSEKATEVNSAISGAQQQSTLINSNAGKSSVYSLSSAANGTLGKNLIIKANIEDNSSTNSAWKVFYDKTKETPEFHYGTVENSLSIVGHNVNGSVVKKVGIKPGNTYSFSALVKGLDIAASGGASIFIGQYDKNDKLIPETDYFYIKYGTFERQKANAKFVANPNASSVEIKLMLDGSGTVWFDEISLINTGIIPGAVTKVVANTEIKKTTYKGFKVTLDGSKSFAVDGSSLTYNWSFESQPVGSTSTLKDVDTANPYFIPDIAGDYILSFTVKDNDGNSDTKKVTIRAKLFSDTSDDDSFNSINRLTQKILTGYTFEEFIPLLDGWIIVGDNSKKQIIILNTLTGEVAKSYQLQETPDRIDFDFDKGIIVATQSTTNNIAKIDVYSDNVSYITAASNTIIGGNSDIAIGKDNVVFFLRNKWTDSWIGILDISQNIEISHKNMDFNEVINAHYIAFNQVNNELIIGDGECSPCSLQRYKYDDKNHSFRIVQDIGELGPSGKDLVISNDGKHIAFCCGAQTIFDINCSDISKNFGEWDSDDSSVSAVFSYDSKYLLAANSSDIRLFSVDNHTLIKKVGPRLWLDVDKIGISRGGRVGYAYTEHEELYIFRIDDSSLLNIDSISTDKETPQLESTNISVTANTSGGTNAKFYHFIVYDGNNWALQQAYSTSNTFNWKPEVAGEYYLVVEAKDADSLNDYDAYNTIRYNITKEPASITISGPSNCTITPGARITLKYSATVEDNEGNIVPKQKVSWSIDGQVAGVLIDDSTGVVTVDSTAQTGSFVIIAKVGEVSNTIPVTIAAVTGIEISGAEKIEIPLIGIATSQYTAVVKDQDGKPMLEELVDWAVYDSEHKPISGLSISNTGLIKVISATVPNKYIIEARSKTNTSAYNTKTILLTAPPSPLLTGFTWTQGNTTGTTKATVVPAGTLKYIVGAAGSQVKPNVGDAATAYINTLSVNADIEVTAEQHIYIVRTANEGTITGWADVAVNAANIKPLQTPAPKLTGFTWEQGGKIGTTKATALPTGTLKYIVGAAGSQAQPNVGDAAAAYTNTLSANSDIAVTAEQHIFIVETGKEGTIIGWADIVVNTTNIKPVPTPAPILTGFTWARGSKIGTTKAIVVPEGTLKYIVGAAGSRVQPKVGDVATAYIKTLTVNADITVSAGQHIFVVRTDSDGTITSWADVVVNTANITTAAPRLIGFTWAQGSTIGTTKATAVPEGTLKYIVGDAGSQLRPNVGDAATAYTNILTANSDIAISPGQHIFVCGVGNDGSITSWVDVALSGADIYLIRTKGDVNDDSVVDALDFALLKMYLLGQTANINKINSDIDLDGEIDAIDFALLKMQLLN